MRFTGRFISISVLALALSSLHACKTLDEFARQAGDLASNNTGSSSPSQAEMATAVRQALSQGVGNAISLLGKADGFNANQLVRIAMPQDLRKADELLRKVGQGKYVDQFVVTMNRAAEQAVPKATSIFTESIKQMSIQDALHIIKGPDDAATQYFRRTSATALQKSFRPVVAQATDDVGVTQAYKKMIGKAGMLSDYISDDAKDLDGYITHKATDALFLYIADEEKKIRENPIARTTEILRKVFGYYSND